jgi:hypothetical protein
MFELGLGLLLAALFIGVYLLITKFLLGQDGRELGGLPPRLTLNEPDSSHALGTGKSRQALTAGELSEHHAGGTRKGSEEI